MAYETYYVNVAGSRTNYTGFNDVTVARPKFIYFTAAGLRPETRHFVFFDKINVSSYVSTSQGNIDTFNNLPRNDSKRNPGEQYINETQFPTALGGPTASIFSDDEGKIEGVFYLQSNSTTNFPCGRRILTVLDISAYNIDAATSMCSAQFVVDGGIEKYEVEHFTTSEKRQRWVPDPPPPPPPPVPPVPVVPINPPVINPPAQPPVTPPVSNDAPKLLITGNERYQLINGVGHIFKTDPSGEGGVDGRGLHIYKSEKLGEVLGDQQIGYNTVSTKMANGSNGDVAKALIDAGIQGLDGSATAGVLVGSETTNGIVSTGKADSLITLVHTAEDSPFDHDWVDQFSGEGLYIGEPGDDDYALNPTVFGSNSANQGL